jgi:signal transduction histidine kinase
VRATGSIRSVPACGASLRPLARVALVLAGLLAFATPAAAAAPREVLVLYPYGRQLQANDESVRRASDGYGFGGLSAGFAARPDVPVVVSSEFLDSTRFGSPDQQRAFAGYLRDKYAQQPPAVLVVVSDVALDFVLRHRAELFPRTPIVHMGVGSAFLRARGALPPDVVGTPVTYDFVGTIEQARRWHPRARRLVLVTGTGAWDREWEGRLRTEAALLSPGLDTVFLAGLTSEELRRRLRALSADTIVYTPGFFRDGSGRFHEPREVARVVAEAAPAPVYAPLATFLGSGIVGGRLVSYETMGRIAAETVLALLDGAAPSALIPPAVLPVPLEVDWRQLRRWGIPDSALPAGTIVRFRQPTLWEAHRYEVVAGVVVMLLQAGLIVALLLERRRRRRSEEHLRLAAQAAGLSTWVYEDDAADATRRPRRPAAPEPPPIAVVDFGDTLARIAPQDRASVQAALQATRDTNGVFTAEYRIQAPDGAWQWQAVRGRVDHARPRRLIGVAADITPRKRAEIQAEHDRAALSHMTRVSLLGQLSASIAHQLNQPLASILSNAEAAQKMLDRTPVDVTELREICTDIVTEDHRAAQVIRRLAALFKRGEPLFEPLDLNDLARDTLELTRSMLSMRHVAVETQLAPALPFVAGDRVQLQQLLLNLIVNAADAMAELPEDRRLLTIRTASPADVVQLCVTDRGPGVSEENVERLFEPFWTTRPGGMGMGLAICRSIAEAHRGSLGVRNAADGGAEFNLELPAVAPR